MVPDTHPLAALVDDVARRVADHLRCSDEGAGAEGAVETELGVALGATPAEAIAIAAGPAAGLARVIDHTLLKADATPAELEQLCAEAVTHGFATVCVNASNVGLCAALLADAEPRPIAVVGFPLGASTPEAKAFEARDAVRRGAEEIDTVVNLGALKGQDYARVFADMAAVVAAAAPHPVKVILETASLAPQEKVVAAVLAQASGAAFVKTSTGFGAGGATVEDVTLLRQVVAPGMGVKASGGVRTTAAARALLRAGANRLGASASVAIVRNTAADTSSGDAGD